MQCNVDLSYENENEKENAFAFNLIRPPLIGVMRQLPNDTCMLDAKLNKG